MRPQISITTDRREGKSWWMLHFLKSFAFFFISVQYGFYYRVITAYDEEKLILIGLMWDVGVAKCRAWNVWMCVRVYPYCVWPGKNWIDWLAFICMQWGIVGKILLLWFGVLINDLVIKNNDRIEQINLCEMMFSLRHEQCEAEAAFFAQFAKITEQRQTRFQITWEVWVTRGFTVCLTLWKQGQRALSI